MEKFKDPSELRTADITHVFEIGSRKYKSEADVIKGFHYKIGKKIGEGGFGMVFKAKDIKKKRKAACKVCRLGNSMKSSKISDMKNELFIMGTVKHFFIVKVYNHFLTESKKHGNTLFLFMEMADGGDFSSFCNKNGPLKESDAKLYFAQILCGINHIHSLGIAHRDIKLQNILMKKHDQALIGNCILLVTDFGLSRILHHSKSGDIKMDETYCGTPKYMAPELLQKKPYNAFMVDIWALGITLMLMVNGQSPYDCTDALKAIKDMWTKNYSWHEANLPEKPSNKLKHLVDRLIEPNADNRIKMDELLRHHWIEDSFAKAQNQASKCKYSNN